MSSGVTQTVSTTANQLYELSFYVGSATDGSIFFPSTLDVSIDGGPRISYFNPSAPTTTLDWRKFTVNFTATTNATNITFLQRQREQQFLERHGQRHVACRSRAVDRHRRMDTWIRRCYWRQTWPQSLDNDVAHRRFSIICGATAIIRHVSSHCVATARARCGTPWDDMISWGQILADSPQFAYKFIWRVYANRFRRGHVPAPREPIRC